jgi:hypothetical protein
VHKFTHRDDEARSLFVEIFTVPEKRIRHLGEYFLKVNGWLAEMSGGVVGDAVEGAMGRWRRL